MRIARASERKDFRSVVYLAVMIATASKSSTRPQLLTLVDNQTYLKLTTGATD